MGRRYVEGLWRLFRKKYRRTYSSSEIKPRFLQREEGPAFAAISSEPGRLETCQSHSARSAWIYKPWKDGRQWYVGFEYKGIGEEGGKIRRFAKTAWGGVYRNNALAEHGFAKKAFDAGIFCQRPLAVYDYGKFYGKDVAVVVRTFASPLRLSDFLFERGFFNRYLEIRGETEREYCDNISSTLGKNVRKLFDIGLYHGTMELNNITTEGELADFEPTYGGTWEGLMENTEPFFRHIALRRLMKAGKTTFPRHFRRFSSNFAQAFFDKDFELKTSNPAKEIAEKYCGTEIEDLKPKFRKNDPLMKAMRMVVALRRKAKTAKEKKVYDYVLKSIKGED